MAILRLLLGLPCVGVALLLGGCGGGDDGERTLGVADAKRFGSYPTYYAGREVAGEALVAVLGDPTSDTRANGWFFVYGECNDFPEGEGGCYPPLQIHNYSLCTRRPYFGSARRTLHIRGAAVAESSEGRLELSTGATTVTVGARERKVALAAIRNLRTVRQSRPGRLPPPIPAALEGTLPCQHVPRKQLR